MVCHVMLGTMETHKALLYHVEDLNVYLKEVREGIIWILEGRVFQAEGTASAKAQRWECLVSWRNHRKRPMWQEWSQ